MNLLLGTLDFSSENTATHTLIEKYREEGFMCKKRMELYWLMCIGVSGQHGRWLCYSVFCHCEKYLKKSTQRRKSLFCCTVPDVSE